MTVRRLRVALAAVTVAIWLAVGRLVVAFWRSELDWRAVASYSRIDAPWYYRLAAVWGGLDGSLLLFAAIVAAVALVGTWRTASRTALVAAIATVAALVAIDIALANPFRRLDIPAIGGFGLTPILEHPAMAVHPPILYTGLALTLVAFLRLVAGDHVASRSSLRLSLALVTVAMALGAIWSYAEQGWGGYWAWDPVENTSLLVWLATIGALHTQRWWGSRWGGATLALPWLLVLVGATAVRSGSMPSIHGFGQRAAIGWWLLALTAASVAAAAAGARRLPPTSAGSSARLGSTVMTVRILAVVAVIVLAGTLAPLAVDLVSDRPAAVRGRFYAAFVGPAALVAVPFLVARLRRVSARGWLAHAGMVVLLGGIGASTFDSTESVLVPKGETVRAAGVSVTNLGVRVEDGPRIESDAVVATVVVDGHRVEPQRVVYRDRGGQLAENALVSRPWMDVQVQLDSANDAEVVALTVYRRPLMWLLWIGALMVAAGAIAPRFTRRRLEVEEPSPPGVLVSVPAGR